MNKYAITAFIFMVLIFSNPAFAINPVNTRVNVIFNHANRPFNLPYLYKREIHYWIRDKNMTIKINGSVISIDMREYIREALREWQVKLESVIFVEDDSYRKDSTTILFFVNEDDNTILADSVPRALKLANQDFGSVVIRKVAFERALDPSGMSSAQQATYEKLKSYLAEQAPDGVIRFVLRYLLKHEVGHIFSLAHTDGTNLGSGQAFMDWFDNTVNDMGVFRFDNFIPEDTHVAPGIMIDNVYAYTEQLHEHLGGRPLRLGDIDVTDQEGEAVNAIYQYQETCDQQSTYRSSRSTSYIDNKPYFCTFHPIDYHPVPPSKYGPYKMACSYGGFFAGRIDCDIYDDHWGKYATLSAIFGGAIFGGGRVWSDSAYFDYPVTTYIGRSDIRLSFVVATAYANLTFQTGGIGPSIDFGGWTGLPVVAGSTEGYFH